MGFRLKSHPRERKSPQVAGSGNVVESIRSLPEVRPRLAFRVKVIVHTYIAALGADVTEKPARAQRAKAKRRAARGPQIYARYAAAVGVALLIAIASFMGLTVIARDSNPGNSLYFIKRAGERIDLTFTWGQERKAEKNLDLAQRRLSELEELISENELKPERVAYLAYEFEQSKQAANNLVEPDYATEKELDLYSRLSNLEHQKTDLARKMRDVAGARGVLEPAAGARVAIYDESGGGPPDGGNSTVSGKTDGEGAFRFTLELDDPSALEQLKAVVELDGRKATMPLCACTGLARTDDGSFRVTVEPTVPVLAQDSEKKFQITLYNGDGVPAAGEKLRLKDISGGGLIDGKSGWATVETDSLGRCDFEFSNKTAKGLSTVRIDVYDGGWKELGEVLVIGKLEFESRKNGVKAQSLQEGFDIECMPDLEGLEAGRHEITITVRKKYEKITDYLE